jgi:pimeloyl-ACP methyl ester carboxylesterase
MGRVGRLPQDGELREAWCDVDGVRLHYRVGGSSGGASPPLVHVHGFGISGRYLVPTAKLLAPEHRTYVPDLPGFGRSERSADAHDISGLARALGRFMDVVDVPRAILVGNSLGCVVILELASEQPERVAAAVFCSPAGGPRNRPLLRAAGALGGDTLPARAGRSAPRAGPRRPR